jgi:flagella basal body P-ring formation protein FlgA
MRLLPLLLLLLALPAATAARGQEIVSIRPLSVVEEPVLRLGDVFEGVDSRGGLAIGAAPAPGRRLVLETPHLLALARAHGLAWRPLSPHERVVVERPGRPVPREEIEAALRTELLRLGLDPEAELELGALLPAMVPPSAPLDLSVEGATLDAATGRFAAVLVVMAEGMPALRQRVVGRAVPTAPAVLATRRLAIGEVVREEDVRAVRLRAERVRPGTAQDPAEVVGQQLRRPLGSGLPFLLSDLGPPALVERNAVVTLVLDGPGMLLTTQGRALEAAPRGALVPVMNLTSRRVVEGEVVGPGRVRVLPGAVPLR